MRAFAPIACVLLALACSRSPSADDAGHGPSSEGEAPEGRTEARGGPDATDPPGASEEGGTLVGTRPPAWELEGWDGVDALELSDLRGCVVMVRFWTDTCPYCRRSLPAMQKLRDRLAGRPVRFVGLYHEKPKGRSVSFDEAVEKARGWGVRFPLGFDHGWNTLERWWLRGERRATSSSFVLDAEGRIVHVHPGPVFFPSDDPRHVRQDRDYRAIRNAIRDALGDATGC